MGVRLPAMRISITYLYVIFQYGYPHSVPDVLAALPKIRKLGFHFLEMEGLGQAHLRAMYAHRKTVAAALADSGLHVHNFCVVDPQLVSLDPAKRSQALDRFRIGAELGEFFGSETLHLASYAPPVRYLSARPYQLGGKGGYKFAGQTRVRIPAGFEWQNVWDALAASCRECADIAAGYGKTVIMEPRVGEVICSVDSLLRLIEYVGRPNFQANFDTGHFSAQRENVALALAKLKGRFANIHISDNAPVSTDHLPIGDGAIDWLEFFRVLKTMNYEGYLGLDLGMSKTIVRDYQKSLDRIRAIAQRLKLRIEV
ncbi:MAG TPA: sugar phosphate isomerase/epimerase family protein [Bryobacteraceae bacterium]|nr:sugar phosphate isomerase/epimerase family protein [Bryobacteraceae bacterium]